jgi:L-2-hydroxyglutarate oxidase LhgO
MLHAGLARSRLTSCGHLSIHPSIRPTGRRKLSVVRLTLWPITIMESILMNKRHLSISKRQTSIHRTRNRTDLHHARTVPTVATMSSSSPSYHTEVAVIGAGVVGLAITRALTRAGKEVLLVEKETGICTATSSRNSEVIHGGLYYPPSSHRAIFCVEGKKLLYDYCRERDIPYRRCGKLIVATEQTQMEQELPSLLQRAELNGVNDVRLMSKADVRFLEPAIECVGALLSPSTGVLDSHTYYLNLLADCEEATVALRTRVEDLQLANGGVRLRTEDGTWISCDHCINCSGLHASLLATKIHGRDTSRWQPPNQFLAKGTYFRLEGGGDRLVSTSPRFQHLIYPVPEPGGLGVHATIDWSGHGVKFGPDVEWMTPETRPDEINYDPDPTRGHKFYAEIRKYWPDLPDGKLAADYVGVRPKLSHPSLVDASYACLPFDDFQIVGPETHGISGLIHLFGIESPGLTSSLGIAEHVRQMVLNATHK